MDKILKEAVLKLYDYEDLLSSKRRELEIIVGDVQEAENLDVYEEYTEQRNEVGRLISQLEDLISKLGK